MLLKERIYQTNLDDFQSTTTSAMITPIPNPTSMPSKTTPSQAANHTTFETKTIFLPQIIKKKLFTELDN